MTSNVKVVMGMTSKTPVFSGLMEKVLDACLDLTFETRLPNNESGPFDMTIEDKKNHEEAVDMNKKAMCQFIQAFSMMSLLKQGQSAKESRQELPEWKSMETVGRTSRRFQPG